MPSNAEARYRNSFRQGQDGLPEYLRSQWQEMANSGDGGNGSSMSAPGYVVRDSQGREVVLLQDDGSIDGQDMDWNEGREGNKRFDPDLGWVTDVANVNQNKFDRRHRRSQLIAGSVIGAGALAGMAGLGAAGAGAAEGVTGTGLAANIPADLALSTGIPGGGTGVALDAMPSIVSGGGGSAGGLAGLGQAASGGGGGLAASIPADLPVGAAGGGSGVALDAMPSIQAAGGGGSLMDRAVSSLGGYQGVARGALGLASLGAAREGGSSGGETNPQSIIEQMANANRVNHNTPFGSRAWSQGQDGRWTVNDTLSPEEQANYEGVRGLNSNVTNMTRDRLAALLAQGPRARYDRPLGS